MASWSINFLFFVILNNHMFLQVCNHQSQTSMRRWRTDCEHQSKEQTLWCGWQWHHQFVISLPAFSFRVRWNCWLKSVLRSSYALLFCIFSYNRCCKIHSESWKKTSSVVAWRTKAWDSVNKPQILKEGSPKLRLKPTARKFPPQWERERESVYVCVFMYVHACMHMYVCASSAVISAHWTTVDWSWPTEWNCCVRAVLHLRKQQKKHTGRKWFIETSPKSREKKLQSLCVCMCTCDVHAACLCVTSALRNNLLSRSDFLTALSVCWFLGFQGELVKKRKKKKKKVTTLQYRQCFKARRFTLQALGRVRLCRILCIYRDTQIIQQL